MKDWKEEAKQYFNDRIETHKISTLGIFKPPVFIRVKIDGEYFITDKGKTVWKGLGPAKNALRLHVFNSYPFGHIQMRERKKIDYRECKDYMESLYQEFLKDRVEFETV